MTPRTTLAGIPDPRQTALVTGKLDRTVQSIRASIRNAHALGPVYQEYRETYPRHELGSVL